MALIRKRAMYYRTRFITWRLLNGVDLAFVLGYVPPILPVCRFLEKG